MVVHTFDALKSKNFSIYMAGQSVALTGMWVQKLATSWLVYRTTESAFFAGSCGAFIKCTYIYCWISCRGMA